MARRRQPVERGEVVLERDGDRHVGSYSIERGMITVHYGGLSKTTQVGASIPHVLAHTLLHELVLERRREEGR
jgi:hypothetical protein